MPTATSTLDKLMALLRMSKFNNQIHEMQMAWEKAANWIKNDPTLLQQLGHALVEIYREGHAKWARPGDIPPPAAQQQQQQQQSNNTTGGQYSYRSSNNGNYQQQQQRRYSGWTDSHGHTWSSRDEWERAEARYKQQRQQQQRGYRDSKGVYWDSYDEWQAAEEVYRRTRAHERANKPNNPRGFTEPAYNVGVRDYTTVAAQPQRRQVLDQVQIIDCQWCNNRVRVVHYPGGTPRYCSQQCRDEAHREQARRRMAEKRARDKRQKGTP